MYLLIGGACLAIWFIGFIGYGMGKDAAWRELGRAGGYDLQQKVLAYRKRKEPEQQPEPRGPGQETLIAAQPRHATRRP